MHKTLSGRIIGLLVVSSLLASHAQAAGSLIELSAGMYRIEAEVAADPPSRETGLMNRESMPPSHGMLFVFPFLATHCMWMRNTLLPLSVAFLDDEGRIINIADMKPQTETNHCAARPARYALEM
ncbi:MAG: hypothetical protein RIR70_1837, partial [Pseudomonadota bacterium]